jgi:CyaY protein
MSAPTFQDSEYHAAADRLLSRIERQADEWLQQGVIDIDTNRAGGLLELAFPNGSKVVVNKQPPLHEIWLAARSGGFHFRWSEGRWLDTRDGHEFYERLAEEIAAQAGTTLAWTVDGNGPDPAAAH